MIYYPKIYGLCAGSNNALSMAYSLSNKSNVVVLKEILHNKTIIEDLKSKGIETVNDLNSINSKNIVIIRAHGEPKSTYEYLDSKGIKYYDATCKNVIRVHKLVESKYNDGYKIIIVGKKTHPEVIGTNGWCNNEALIIENENDIEKIENQKIFVVAQTTTSEKEYINILNILKKQYDIEYVNTICAAQKLIQDSSVELASNIDIMLIIGGANSSNTKELFNKCNSVCRSEFITCIEDLKTLINKKVINSDMKIGITGGASTPRNQIDLYSNYIKENI